MVGCDLRLIDEIGNYLSTRIYPKGKEINRYLSFKNCFAHNTILIKKSSVLMARGYNSGFNSGNNNANESFSRLLFGRSKDDNVEFLGTNVVIEDLIEGRYVHNENKFQSFGLYTNNTRGKNQRYYLETLTTLTATSLEELDYNDYYERLKTTKISVDIDIIHNHDWYGCYVSNRKEKLSIFDKVVNTLEKFNITTKNTIKMSGYSKLSFIFNDVGSTGKDRFKALVNDYAAATTADIYGSLLIYVEYHPKANKQEDVLKELNELISSTLTGATVKMLSALPDARPAVKREKTSKDQLKLKVLTFKKRHVVTKQLAEEYLGYGKGIKLNTQKFDSNTEYERVISIAELSTKNAVLFVFKRGNKKEYLNDEKSSSGKSFISNIDLMTYANHIGLFNEVLNEEDKMEILVLNESTHEKLTKAGVKLVTVNSLIIDKINQLNQKEGFVDEVSRFISLTKANHIKDMHKSIIYSNFTAIFKDPNSLFKLLLEEYGNLHTKIKNNAEIFTKLEVMNLVQPIKFVNIYSDADEIRNKLDNKYQILSLFNYSNIDNTISCQKVVTYINQIDSLIATAVTETTKELEHLEEIA